MRALEDAAHFVRDDRLRPHAPHEAEDDVEGLDGAAERVAIVAALGGAQGAGEAAAVMAKTTAPAVIAADFPGWYL